MALRAMKGFDHLPSESSNKGALQKEYGLALQVSIM